MFIVAGRSALHCGDHDFAIAITGDGMLATRTSFLCSWPVAGGRELYEPRSFAYSLSQVESGWLWSVIDEDGQTVARGADASRDAAQAAVDRTLMGPSGFSEAAA